MWVKICANTSAGDALKAVELGANAIGFVFAPSKRQVEVAQVKAITAKMPPEVELVGVFAGSDAEAIAATVHQSGLNAVQLHGGVNRNAAERLRSLLGPNVETIHCVHWTLGKNEASEQAVRAQLLQLQPGERVLIDARVGSMSGGLGISFNWQRAASVLREFPQLRVIVAGGLNSANVADAIGALNPYGVDVASGVERSPGKKDFEKLRHFIENARRT